jgi:hypothetical protein
MDYYYKYLKYKTKYLELKGGKMEYGLYGFYSYYGDTLNLRTNNKRFNEINYVHDLPLGKDANGDNIVIQHLRSNCTIDTTNNKITEYYPGIKSFKFVPYGNLSQDDINKIQKLIDTTYFTKELDIENLKWTTLNQLKRFRYRGYSDKISKTIIDSYAAKATELLGDENKYKSDKDDITKIRRKALKLQRDRKCGDIHKHPNESTNILDSYEKILLEEVIDDNEKQLLLSSIKTGIKYGNNPKIHMDPYSLFNEKLGILSWNMIINKATINCIMKYHNVLFPIRIILDIKPETLFYENILESKKFSNYIGFFLIRFKNDSDEYTKNSKPNDSDEQYYIFFIFKKEMRFVSFPLYTYTLTNFRNNIVNWGTVTEKKTVLFHEILQLICIYLNNNVHFYLVSNENKSDNYHNIKTWIFSGDLKYINFDNEIHILVSKDNIDTVADKLGKQIWEYENKYKYIQYNENYRLFQCHFGWYDDPTDRFCIKLGNMNKDKIQNLKQNACIYKLEDKLFKLDQKRLIQPNGLINVNIDDDVRNFDLNGIIDLELNKIITDNYILNFV